MTVLCTSLFVWMYVCMDVCTWMYVYYSCHMTTSQPSCHLSWKKRFGWRDMLQQERPCVTAYHALATGDTSIASLIPDTHTYRTSCCSASSICSSLLRTPGITFLYFLLLVDDRRYDFRTYKHCTSFFCLCTASFYFILRDISSTFLLWWHITCPVGDRRPDFGGEHGGELGGELMWAPEKEHTNAESCCPWSTACTEDWIFLTRNCLLVKRTVVALLRSMSYGSHAMLYARRLQWLALRLSAKKTNVAFLFAKKKIASWFPLWGQCSCGSAPHAMHAHHILEVYKYHIMRVRERQPRAHHFRGTNLLSSPSFRTMQQVLEWTAAASPPVADLIC